MKSIPMSFSKSLVLNITLGSFSQSSKRPSMMDIQNKVFDEFLNLEESSAQYRRIERADGDNVKVNFTVFSNLCGNRTD